MKIRPVYNNSKDNHPKDELSIFNIYYYREIKTL